MSDCQTFSQVLNNIKKKYHLNVKELAACTQIPVSSFYHILNGSRIPNASSSLVEDICLHYDLEEKDYEALQDAFDQTVYGSKRNYHRKIAADFIESIEKVGVRLYQDELSAQNPNKKTSGLETGGSKAKEAESRPAETNKLKNSPSTNRPDFDSDPDLCIQALFENLKPDQSVQFFLPADMPNLKDYLFQLTKRKSGVKIEYVVPLFSKKDDENENLLASLALVLTIGALCSSFSCTAAKDGYLNLNTPYPWFMVCSDSLILFASDMKSCLYLKNSELAGSFSRQFAKLQQASSSFFRIIDNGIEKMDYFSDMLLDSACMMESGLLLYQKQPCFSYIFTPELIHEILKIDEQPRFSPLRILANKFSDYVLLNRKLPCEICYFSLQGLDEFVKNTRLYEYPEFVLKYFTPFAKIKLLEGVKELVESGIMQAVEMNKTYGGFDFRIYIDHKQCYIEVQSDFDQEIHLDINNPDIMNILRFYLQTLPESKKIGAQKTIDYIDFLIEKLQAENSFSSDLKTDLSAF